MSADPETPDVPPEQNGAAESEVGIETMPPAESAEEAADQSSSPESSAPDAEPAEVQLGESPSDVDRLVEEQMLAQLAEAEGAESQADLPRHEIREPDMDFPKVSAELPTAQSVEFPQLGQSSSNSEPRNFDLLMDVKLPVSIELGRTSMAIAEILALGSGSIVELDKLAGEPVDLLVNNKTIAHGEVVVVDENFGIRITSLLSPQERIKSL